MKVGSGLALFGQVAQGRNHLHRAVALAEENRLGERLFRAETLLQHLSDDITPEQRGAMSSKNPETAEQPLRATLDSLLELKV